MGLTVGRFPVLKTKSLRRPATVNKNKQPPLEGTEGSIHILNKVLYCRDRELNNETYPALHYPECYLLHDGYKKFYSSYPHLCDPQSYIPMAHPGYISEERKFHKKARTWAAGGGSTVARTGASSRLLKL